MKKLLAFLLFLPFLTQAQTSPDNINAVLKTAPTVTTLAALTALSGPAAHYDGDTWIRVSGATSTTTVGYPGYVVPSQGAYHYERIFSIMKGISVARMGADGDSTTYDNTPVLRAIAFARAKGTFTWVDPIAQKYYLSPITLQSGDQIRGVPTKSRIRRDNTRGPAFSWTGDRVVVEGLDVFQHGTDYEGPIYFSGSHNTVRYVRSYGSHTTTFVITDLVLNGSGLTVKTEHNLIEHNHAEGQRSYHETGGKSPFIIAGIRARYNIVQYNYAKNNTPCDAFDIDNATDNTVQFNTAEQEGTQSEHAAFWFEGGEDSTRNVGRGNLAINFAIGFGTSELCQAEFLDSRALFCKRIIGNVNGNTLPMYARNVSGFKCGNGFETSDIDGTFLMPGPATLDNCYADSTYAKYDVVNYSGTGTATTLTINGGRYKTIMAAYENTGNEDIHINNVTVGQIRAQNSGTPTRKLFINGGNITSLSISRIWQAQVTGVTFLGNGTGTAMAFSGGGYYNTEFNGNYFENYDYIVTPNTATQGVGNRWVDITNPPLRTEKGYVQGRPETAVKFLTTLNVHERAGFYTVSGPPETTGAPTDPFGPNWNTWYVYIHPEENGGSGEVGTVGNVFWQKQEIWNLNGSAHYIRFHNGATEIWESWMPLPAGDYNAVMAAKAPLASPALTGTPTAPTAITATNNTQIATTAFVHAFAGALGGGGGAISVDDTPTDGSNNAVKSNGVFDALAGKADLSHTHSSTAVTDFSEATDDRVNALIVAGTGITSTYNDGANTLTIAATGSGDGLPAPPTNGIVTQTTSGTIVARTFTSGSSSLSITNGDGVAGNPTIYAVTPTTKRAYYERIIAGGNLVSKSGLGGLTIAPSGSGAGATYNSDTPSGVFGISTGTTTTGYTFFGTDQSFFNPNGTTKYAVEGVIKVPVYSDGTNTYQAYAGFGNNITNAGNYVGFTLESNALRGRSVLSSSTQGTQLGSGTQTTSTFYRIRIEFNGTTAKYYMKTETNRFSDPDEWPWALDGSDVLGTYTDGSGSIDFASGPFGGGVFIKKSAGTTAVVIQIDQLLITKMNGVPLWQALLILNMLAARVYANERRRRASRNKASQ